MEKTNKKKEPAKRGHPSTFTDETADKICALTASSSKSLKTICDEIGISVITVQGWLRTRENFASNYARAKDDQADFLVEEMMSISDDSGNDLLRVDEYGNKIENKEFVNRSRLRVDTRKWIAAHLKPRKYSERLELSGSLEVKQITGMEIK